MFILFTDYIAYRTVKGDPRDAWIKNFAVAFAATGGTTFKNANLTDANFTKATLKSTDFRDPTLTENIKDIQKIEALEAVESLTEAANNPEDSNLKKLAKLSKNALIGIAANLTNATKLVQECNQLLGFS